MPSGSWSFCFASCSWTSQTLSKFDMAISRNQTVPWCSPKNSWDLWMFIPNKKWNVGLIHHHMSKKRMHESLFVASLVDVSDCFFASFCFRYSLTHRMEHVYRNTVGSKVRPKSVQSPSIKTRPALSGYSHLSASKKQWDTTWIYIPGEMMKISMIQSSYKWFITPVKTRWWPLTLT